MNTDAENWKYDVLLLKIYSIYFRERDDYGIMINPFLCVYTIYMHTHTHVIRYIVVWRSRGDGSALFDVLALSWLLLWISLSLCLHSICAKTFFTHDNVIMCASLTHTHSRKEGRGLKVFNFSIIFRFMAMMMMTRVMWEEMRERESFKQLIAGIIGS